MIALVVAYSANRVIGRDGDLPWRLPSDVRRFRAITTGRAVVMGRKTWESLPDAFRPLPERRNLVLSTDASYEAAGAEVFGSLPAALQAAEGDAYIIGGGATYAEALPLAQRIYATEVDADIDGDTFFPELPESEWALTEDGDPFEENGLRFTFRLYERRA